MNRTNIHANCLVIGTKGVLIRGASGSGKSSLCDALLEAARIRGQHAAFIADDQVLVSSVAGRVIAEPPQAISGMAEVRGFGLVKVPHLPKAHVHMVIDLVSLDDIERFPEVSVTRTAVGDAQLPCISCPANAPQSAIRLIRWAFKHLFPGIADYF